MVLETERLVLREMGQADLPALCEILQDPLVMYAYEHAFSDDEAQAWLDRQRERYATYGFGLWAVILRETGEMIGQCGVTMQDWCGREVPEVGYLFRRSKWHQGFAAEAAAACRDYAFHTLGFPEVFSIIRENNFPSQHVALRCGMSVRGAFVKQYYGMDMPHLVFGIRRSL